MKQSERYEQRSASMIMTIDYEPTEERKGRKEKKHSHSLSLSLSRVYEEETRIMKY